MKYLIGGCLLYGAIFFVLFWLRPKSKLHTMTLETFDRKKKIMTFTVMALLVLLCTIPMGIVPGWNGTEDQRQG